MMAMNIKSGAITAFGQSHRTDHASIARQFGRLFRLWLDQHRERLALGELDARLLRDIDLSPIDAEREAERPFWEGGERRGRRRS